MFRVSGCAFRVGGKTSHADNAGEGLIFGLHRVKFCLSLYNLQSILHQINSGPHGNAMHVVTAKHLKEAAEQYPDAANEINAWHKVARAARWQNFVEVKQIFKDADDVDGYVIFNIRRNRYRLVTIIHYSRRTGGRVTEGHIYVRSFLTHKQYDQRSNWDKGIRS